jgi:hypothetical protein
VTVDGDAHLQLFPSCVLCRWKPLWHRPAPTQLFGMMNSHFKSFKGSTGPQLCLAAHFVCVPVHPCDLRITALLSLCVPCRIKLDVALKIRRSQTNRHRFEHVKAADSSSDSRLRATHSASIDTKLVMADARASVAVARHVACRGELRTSTFPPRLFAWP